MQIALVFHKEEIWNMTYASQMAFVIDILLENSLPREMMIEAKVKTLIGNGAYQLTDLGFDRFIAQQEKTNIKALVSVLTSKFKIFSTSNEALLKACLSKEDLFISIGITLIIP